jgi:multiple sugar transport system substrate-binding protein
MKKSVQTFSRRAFLRATAGATAVGVLAACAPVGPPAGGAVSEAAPAAPAKTELATWYFFSTDPRRSYYERLCEEFSAASAEYTITPTFVEFGAYQEKLLPSIVAGNPPDVGLATGMIDAPPMGLANQIIPLDDYLATSDELTFEGFVPYTQQSLVYDGKLWGVPFVPDTRFLHMDVDAMEEVGLDPAQPPITWEDLWNYAHQLDKGSAPNWERIGFSPTWGNTWPWTMIWTNGGELVDENNNFTINTPEAIETAAWYKEWVDYYGLDAMLAFSAGFGPGAQDPFTGGLNPLQINGSWYPGRIHDQNPEMRVAYAIIPYNKTPASWGAGNPFIIPVGAGSPDGAWSFIEYVLSYDVLLGWMLATGTMVGRVDVMEDPQIMETLDHWPVAVESIKVTRERPLVPEVPTWYAYVKTAFDEVWDGVKTPEQALADAQAAVEQELQNYRATQG